MNKFSIDEIFVKTLGTREEKINDGLLIDLTRESKKYNMRVPVCIHSDIFDEMEKIWGQYISLDEQDIKTILINDILFALKSELVFKIVSSNSIVFPVSIFRPKKLDIYLKAVIHEGDKIGEAVLTITGVGSS